MGGATTTKIMVTNITHLLCGADFDENDIDEATDLYDIPSVTEEWVTACVKLGRLANLKVHHPIPSGLFAKLVMAITQVSVADRKKIYAFVTYHGGQVTKSLSSKTTHLICGSAMGNAYNKAMEMKLEKLTIVTPDWLFESFKEEKLVDTIKYHPRLLTGTAQNLDNDQSLSSILGMDNDTNNAQPKTDQVDGIQLDPNKNTINHQLKDATKHGSNMSNQLLTPKSTSLAHNNSSNDDLTSPNKILDADFNAVFGNDSVITADMPTDMDIDSLMNSDICSDDKSLEHDISAELADMERSQEDQLLNGTALQSTGLQQCQSDLPMIPNVSIHLGVYFLILHWYIIIVE